VKRRLLEGLELDDDRARELVAFGRAPGTRQRVAQIPRDLPALDPFLGERGAREALSVISTSYEYHGGFRLRTLSA